MQVSRVRRWNVEQFIKLQDKVPEAFFNALLKEKLSLADIVKINCAIEEL